MIFPKLIYQTSIEFSIRNTLLQKFLQTDMIFFYQFKDFLVWVEALHPNQQFFSHVGTEPLLPGYYQYFLGGKCILLKDTTRQPE